MGVAGCCISLGSGFFTKHALDGIRHQSGANPVPCLVGRHVEDRDENQGDQRRGQQTADHNTRQRCLHLRTGTNAHRQRYQTKHSGQRRH